MDKLLADIWNYLTVGSGDKIANYLGLLLTLVGFSITLVSIRKSIRQVKEVRKDIKRIDTVSDLAQAISLIDEIRRLQRQEDWNIIPDRFSSLRRLIVSIKTTYPDLNDDQKTCLQSALMQTSNNENAVERIIKNSGERINIPKMNRILSETSDSIYEMLINLRNGIGVKNDN